MVKPNVLNYNKVSTKQLWDDIGGLSKVSKMPAWSYAISAYDCKTGSKLVHVENSVCNSCYALKGRFRFNSAQKAMKNRLDLYNTDALWEFKMIELIRRKYRNISKENKFFRWMTSGDIQDVNQLRKIAIIAENTSDIKYWLSTRENSFVKSYLEAYGAFPDNLCVRVSNHMIDNYNSARAFKNTSSVVSDKSKALDNNICPATIKGNDHTCNGNNNCRNCWNKDISNIAYIKH